MRLLLLSDGKPGHLTSSRGIARHLPETIVIEQPIHFRSKQRDNRLRIIARLMGWTVPSDTRLIKWLQAALTPESYAELCQQNEVDAILSTGSSIAAVNFCWSKVIGIPSIVCRYPSPMGISYFDKAVLPRYQWPHHPRLNVIQTLGIPNQVTPALLAKYRLLEKQVPCLGILIGGDDDYFTITPERASAYCQSLLQVAESTGITFAVTTSRRTPPEAEQVFIENLAHHELCMLFVSVHTTNQTGQSDDRSSGQPVMMIMAMSDVLLVTEDSYSMVCESLSSARPVILLQVDRRRRSLFSKQDVLPKRQQDFHVMAKEHALLTSEPMQLGHQVERALALGWPQKALRDAEHAAHEISVWIQMQAGRRVL